jgi:Cdc6-like AAA superfamily ATPase
VPDYLPCREREVDYIEDYVRTGLQNKGSSTSLYISGMPGTGKTATTLEVIRRIQEDNKKYKFKFIQINGMQLSNPNSVYSIIY